MATRDNAFDYNPRPSTERNPLAGLGRSNGDQAARLDFVHTNGEDLAYHQNLARNLGFTPQMYNYMVSEYQRRFPGGLAESEAAGYNKDTAAISFHRTSHPYAVAKEMAEKGLEIGSTPEFMEYIARTQRDAPDRVDWSFLEGYQPTKEAPKVEGLPATWFPDYDPNDPGSNYTPNFGVAPPEGESLQPGGPNMNPSGGPLDPFPGTPQRPWGTPQDPFQPQGGGFQPIDWGGPGGEANLPQGPQAIESFLPGSRNDAFYTQQFNQLANQNNQFQRQQALARQIQSQPPAQPPAGQPPVAQPPVAQPPVAQPPAGQPPSDPFVPPAGGQPIIPPVLPPGTVLPGGGAISPPAGGVIPDLK